MARKRAKPIKTPADAKAALWRLVGSVGSISFGVCQHERKAPGYVGSGTDYTASVGIPIDGDETLRAHGFGPTPADVVAAVQENLVKAFAERTAGRSIDQRSSAAITHEPLALTYTGDHS